MNRAGADTKCNSTWMACGQYHLKKASAKKKNNALHLDLLQNFLKKSLMCGNLVDPQKMGTMEQRLMSKLHATIIDHNMALGQ